MICLLRIKIISLDNNIPEYFEYEDTIITTKADIANCFNHYFTNIPELLVSQIGYCTFFHKIHTGVPIQNEFFKFQSVEKEDISFINDLKYSNSSGYDNISTKE